MQKKKRIAITAKIVCQIILITLFLISCGSDGGKKNERITSIMVGKVKRSAISNIEALTGNILSIQQANIYSKVSGNIEKIYVDIGDYVKQGQLIALIDTTVYSQNAKQASANYQQTLANLANSKLLYDRNVSLLEQNLIAKQDVDNSKTAYDVALAQKDAAYANYINAITQLGYCRIVAPYTGYITKRYFDAGVYVTASTVASSSILFILSDLDNLKVMTYLPEKEIGILNRIVDIDILPDGLPGQVFKGHINKVSGALDLSTRTMEIQIGIQNSNKILKPGMFSKVNLIMETHNDVFILSNDIVLNDQSGDYVFVVNLSNDKNITSTVKKKYVKLGIKEDTNVEILSGIDENDLLVVSGQNLIKEGSKVNIVK